MTGPVSELFDAFRQDHDLLGRGLYEVSTALRGGDLREACRAARRLDREAGAHIAFEEEYFYPALRLLLGDTDVDRFYGEHDIGLGALQSLIELPDDAAISAADRARLIKDLELMQAHVAECGELFGAMGRIPDREQAKLLRQLIALREGAPLWSELINKGDPR